MGMRNAAWLAERPHLFVVGSPASLAIGNLVARGRDHEDVIAAVCWMTEGFARGSGRLPADPFRHLTTATLPEGLDVETLTDSADDLLTEEMIPIGDEDIATAALEEGKSVYLSRMSPPPRF